MLNSVYMAKLVKYRYLHMYVKMSDNMHKVDKK